MLKLVSKLGMKVQLNMNFAIIPARSGSKRLPNKNIRDFEGAPVITYSIRTALKSGLFDKVIVSTDSKEIAEIAKQHGAEAPFLRPASLAGDHTGTIPVLHHAEEWLKHNCGELSFGCCIYPVNPLLSTDALQRGHSDLIKDSKKDFAISVVRYGYPVQRSFKINHGNLEMLYPEKFSARSQDLEPIYHDAAQFYWWRAGSLTENTNFFSDKTIPIEIPEIRVQDVDNELDWQLMTLKYRLLCSQITL